MSVELTEDEKRKIHEDIDKLRQEVLAQFRKPFQTPSPKPAVIVYCTTFHGENVKQLARILARLGPHVDRYVLVHDGTVTASDLLRLTRILEESNRKLEFVYRQWEDHEGKQRNACLDHIEEDEWVITSDPDEVFNLALLKELHTIIADAEKQGLTLLGINYTNIITENTGSLTRTTSDRYKYLLFKFEEGVRYVGRIRETPLPGIHGWRATNLNPRYYFDHFQTRLQVYEHGARNIFIAGGGSNALTKNPMYHAWHELATMLNLHNWPAMRDYIRKGNIHPGLKQLFIDHRNDNGWDYENESRAPFLWYKTLFPEEMKEYESKPGIPSIGSPPEVMAYVEEQYLKILERQADQKGKEAYADAILRGVIPRDELPTILKNSAEYKQKHAVIK